MNLRTLSVTEAVEMTGLKRRQIVRLIDEGQVAGNRVGKLYRVSLASLEAWVMKTAAPPAAVETRAFPEVEDRFA